ncbi:hypothetical protein JG687_00017406, partial [Phytophthora cactorum]
KTQTTPPGVVGHCICSKFGEVVGKLARRKELNDAAMDAALRNVSTHSANCYAIDAVSVTDEKPFIPDFPVSSCNFVLVLVHMITLNPRLVIAVSFASNGSPSFVAKSPSSGLLVSVVTRSS